MICLGIESTAHTLGIGTARDGKILSNALHTYKPEKEGIVPRKAADHHAIFFAPVLKKALKEAKIGLPSVDLFAFSQGPGIGQCLRCSCAGAKYLSLKYEKPVIGVNHPKAHIEISRLLTKMKDPLVLYVSGGNTQIIIEERGRFRVLGETLDIGVGNLFDSFARRMGLRFQHGSVIEKMARRGKYIPLPYTVKGMNFAFTGLFTAAAKKLKSERKEDLCYSIMETSFAMLTEAMERALCLTRKKELLVCGGVAQNKRLQKMLRMMAKGHRCRFGVAPGQFNADNGAMIAYTGLLEYKGGKRMGLEECAPIQKQRIDNV